MDEWITSKIAEDREREYELERLHKGVPRFLATLKTKSHDAVKPYLERFPDERLKAQDVKLGLHVIRRGLKSRAIRAIEFRVIPESRPPVLQCGPVNGEKLEFDLYVDEAGKIGPKDDDWDSLLKHFLTILFSNS